MTEKTRIGVTVTKSVVDQVKQDIKSLGLHPATLSNLVDEWLTEFAPTLNLMAEKKRKGEQLSFEDVIGTVVEGIAREAIKS